MTLATIRSKFGHKSYRQMKKIVIGVIGGTVVLLGVAMLVLPGPAFIVIPAGLAILATEFAWARLWLRRAKGFFRKNNRVAD